MSMRMNHQILFGTGTHRLDRSAPCPARQHAANRPLMTSGLAGCVQRAGCLHFYRDLVKYQVTNGSILCIPWQELCERVPMHQYRELIDQWLLSSGDASPQPYVPGDHTWLFAVLGNGTHLKAGQHNLCLF